MRKIVLVLAVAVVGVLILTALGLYVYDSFFPHSVTTTLLGPDYGSDGSGNSITTCIGGRSFSC